MKKSTAITIQPAQIENGIVRKNEILQIYSPKTQFEGGSVKWFDDTRLIKKTGGK